MFTSQWTPGCRAQCGCNWALPVSRMLGAPHKPGVCAVWKGLKVYQVCDLQPAIADNSASPINLTFTVILVCMYCRHAYLIKPSLQLAPLHMEFTSINSPFVCQPFHYSDCTTYIQTHAHAQSSCLQCAH